MDQQQRILMERAAARAPAARPLPSGFGAVPPGMPSGFGKRAKAALAGASSHGDAYQRGVIRCAACLVDRYPQRLLMICAQHLAPPSRVNLNLCPHTLRTHYTDPSVYATLISIKEPAMVAAFVSFLTLLFHELFAVLLPL